MGEDVYHILNFVTRITIIVGRNKQDFVQVFQGSGIGKMEDAIPFVNGANIKHKIHPSPKKGGYYADHYCKPVAVCRNWCPELIRWGGLL